MRKQATIDELLPKLKEHLPELSKEYHIRALGVFGSYVRGEQKKRSDLDILVEFNQTPSLFTFLELEEKLKRILGVKVDLVTKKALKPAIGRHILSEVTYV